MNNPEDHHDDQGEVFLDNPKMSHEVEMDEDEADDCVHIFTGHISEVYTVACSPTDPTSVATGGRENEGFLWKIGQEDFALELKGHKGIVSTLAFSNDGQLLASGDSGSFEGLIQIWDAVSGDLKGTLKGPTRGIEWVKWHPREHIILAGSEDSSVWMWSADTKACLNTFSGHDSWVTCGNFTPDGKTICTGSDDDSLRIWNSKTGENVHVVRDLYSEGIRCLTITSDSTVAIIGTEGGSIKIVHITTGKVVRSLPSHSDSITCLRLSPSYCWLASGSIDTKLIIWDLERYLPRSTCYHEDIVTCISWLGASYYVATGCVGGKIRIWNSLLGDCVRIFHDHKLSIQDLSVSANHRYLVSISLDASARVFEIEQYARYR